MCILLESLWRKWIWAQAVLWYFQRIEGTAVYLGTIFNTSMAAFFYSSCLGPQFEVQLNFMHKILVRNSTHFWTEGDKSNTAHQESGWISEVINLSQHAMWPCPKEHNKTRKNAWTEKLVYDQWENERILGSHPSRTVINKSFMRLVLRDYPHRRDVGWNLC